MPGILNHDSTAILASVFVRDSDVYTDTRSLDRDLAAIAEKTLLADIPKEHMLAHARLTKILRGTRWVLQREDGRLKLDVSEAWPNFFTDETQCITINIPLTMKLAYKRLTKAAGDYLWSKSLGGSFWARDRGHRRSLTDLILPWAFRHEYGHSVDYLTQFMNRFGSRREFGGWVAYKGADAGGEGKRSRRVALVQDVLVGVCRDRRERPRSVEDCKAATDCLANFISQKDAYVGKGYRATIEAAIAGVADARLRGHLERVWQVIAAGAGQPWLRGDLLAMEVVDGRVYSYSGGDDAWFGFDAAAYRQRVSNYQFASPSEWFAEYYSARYAEKTGPAMHATLRKYMSRAIIEEIDDLLRRDCGGRPTALRPFKWSDGGDDQFTAKQRAYVERCRHYQRDDGTYCVIECKLCKREESDRSFRVAQRKKLLDANVLCVTCSQALAQCDLFTGSPPALCSPCAAKVAGVQRLQDARATLDERCKQPVPVCPQRHWTPTPIDSFDGLIPCPWYDL